MVYLSSNPPGRNEPVRFDHLIELLAPAIGKEKSEDLISSSARALNYATDQLNLEQAIEILTALGAHAGIVGVSARFAKTRLMIPHRKQDKLRSVEQSLAPLAEMASPLRSAATTLDSGELIALLANSLGTEKSREVVGVSLSQLGFRAGTLDAQQARQVLDLMAESEGIVGVASRFAQSRLSLRFKPG